MYKHIKFWTVCATLALSVPLMVSAQTTGLSETIRAEIMKDPRSASIPQAQIDAMVSSLSQAATQQGITQADITWQPVQAAAASHSAAECNFFCTVNAIFGFGGNDYTIPLGLGITSALLILFISMMLHRHHTHGIEPTVESIHTHA